MDLNAHLAPRPPIEVPALGLIAPRRRLGLAFVLAIVLHAVAVLTPLGVVFLIPGMRAGESLERVGAPPQPTPVTVVFYEDPPAVAATPPPGTATASDRASRARSEVVPEPGRDRQPAGTGESRELRAERPAVVQPPRAPPGSTVDHPEPAPAVTPAPLARSTPAAVVAALRVPDDAMLPTSAQLADLAARARAARAAARPGDDTRVARPGFSSGAIDSAVQARSGYGHGASDVSETGSLSFDAADYEWGPYARKVYEIVNRNWKSVMPLAAQTPGVKGRVRLRFRIHADGRLSDLELVESSQRRALDQASLASIEMSDPLPPLPEDFHRDEVGVTFSYYYNLDPE